MAKAAKRNTPDVNSHILDVKQLEQLRRKIESFDTIEPVSPAVRRLVAERWHKLLKKSPPEDKG